MERFTLLKSDFLRLPTERWHMVEIMPIVIFRSEIPYKESTRAITGQRGSLPVTPLGYLNFKKVIFRTMQTMRKTVSVNWLTSRRFSAPKRGGVNK